MFCRMTYFYGCSWLKIYITCILANIINYCSFVSSFFATNYPVTIAFDTSLESIYPNMSVNASIITSVTSDVLLVPSIAIQKTNGQSTVRILQNGQPVSQAVETGNSSDSQTEIKSGLNVGDTVITSIQTSGQSTSGTSSPFSRQLRIGGGGGFGGRWSLWFKFPI